MQYRGYDVSANVSTMFTEFPFLERFRAAANAGFTAVETWWPFPEPVAGNDDVERFATALDEAGVALTGLNFWGGDMLGGDRGVAAIPERVHELRANFPSIVEIAERTGCRAFNLLYGKVGGDAGAAHETAARIIEAAADAVADLGGTVLLEALTASANGTYPLHTPEDIFTVVDRLDGRKNVRLLFDMYHLSENGVDIVEAARHCAPRIGHVQFADSPGRGEPGSGSLPLGEACGALAAHGYTGSVAAEYFPTTATADTLGWQDA